MCPGYSHQDYDLFDLLSSSKTQFSGSSRSRLVFAEAS